MGPLVIVRERWLAGSLRPLTKARARSKSSASFSHCLARFSNTCPCSGFRPFGPAAYNEPRSHDTVSDRRRWVPRLASCGAPLWPASGRREAVADDERTWVSARSRDDRRRRWPSAAISPASWRRSTGCGLRGVLLSHRASVPTANASAWAMIGVGAAIATTIILSMCQLREFLSPAIKVLAAQVRTCLDKAQVRDRIYLRSHGGDLARPAPDRQLPTRPNLRA